MTDSTPDSAVPVLVLCRDLLFGSKISATAQALKIPFKMIRDPAKLAAEVSSKRMIVDLSQDGYLDVAVEWKRASGGHVVGFTGHTDTQTIQRARELGLDHVFSRGEFVGRINEILSAK